MAVNLYARHVNKRISAARQLLACCQNSTLDKRLIPALVESAVLQARLGFQYYLYELLESYREDYGVNNQSLAANATVVRHSDIPDLIENHKANVTEFAEFSQLLQASDSWLAILSAYPHRLLSDPLAEIPSSENSVNKDSGDNLLRLVDADSVNADKVHPLDQDSVLWLIEQMTECIQRQREHLIEC